MSNNQNSKLIRYSDEDLQEFKMLIEKKLESAKEELDFIKEQIIELNENGSEQQGGDWVDDSSVYSELEMLNRMAERQQKFVQSLESALVRIGNKTYGICSVTGKLIDKKRLLLVPHATKTVEGKEKEKVEEEKKPPVTTERLTSRSNDEDEDEDGDSAPKKAAITPKSPKIITKILRKPSANPAPKRQIKDDDDLDLDKDLVGDDSDYDNDMLGLDLDDIADDDSNDPSEDSQDMNW